MEGWNDGIMEEERGILEYWNVGILSVKPSKIHSLSVLPIIPFFHSSNFPSFQYSVISYFG